MAKHPIFAVVFRPTYTLMQPTRRFVLISSLILFILSAGYYYLGGLNPVPIEVAEVPSFALAGRSYRGTTTDAALRKLMQEVHQEVETGKLRGTFMVGYLGNPDRPDTLNVWVGARLPSLADTSEVRQAGWQVRLFAGGKAMQATVKAHPLVAPSPVRINEKIREKARREGVELQNIITDEYQEDQTVITTIFAKF